MDFAKLLAKLELKSRLELRGDHPRPCKLWLGSKDNKGYGHVRCPPGTMGVKTGVVRVHRLSFWIAHPEFNLANQVDHWLHCNYACWEPSHLCEKEPEVHGRESAHYQRYGLSPDEPIL